MLNLPTPASTLQIVTGSAVTTIAVHASTVDLGPGTAVTPRAFNTPIIAAATTVVVPAPGVGVDRNVKFLSINNESASSCVVTVQIADGINTVNVFGPVPLPSGWTVQYNSDGNGFVLYDNFGNIQVVARVAALNALAAGTQIGSTGTIVFSDSNGVSFGMSNSSVVTASFATIQGSVNLSAGTTSNLASAFTFANSNGVSFGLDVSTLTASVAINVSAGTTSNNVSAITFANSNGVSFGLNGSTLTASAAVGTVTAFSQDADFVTNFPIVPGVMSLQKLSLAMNLEATALAIIADFKGATNLTDAVTLSHAVYTLSGGTARLASSGSRLFSWTSGSDTSASSVYGGASGTRYRTLSVSYAMTPGDYLFGWWMSTENGVTINAFGRAAMNLVGTFGGLETAYFLPGVSASTLGVFPVSIPATATGYIRTGFSALRQPGVILVGTN